MSPIAQLGQALAERVHVGRRLRASPVVQRPVIAVSMSGEAWMAVRCMWCSTPRMPPSSSPPPARPGPPCTSTGSGEPWPVDSFGVVAVEHQDPAVPRRDAEHHARARTSGSCVTTEPTRLPWPRAASSTASSSAVVGEHRADRAERLDVVRLAGAASSAAQQQRRQERAALGVGVDDVDAGRGRRTRPRPTPRSACDRLAHLLALVEAGQRAHPHRLVGRVADGDLRPAAPRSPRRRRRRSPAGTIARRIAVHFWPALTVISVTTPLDEQVELRVARR